MIKKYLKNLAYALDQLLNTLFAGDPDETISSRLGKNYPNSRMTKIVNVLFAWQKRDGGHCASSVEEDEGEMAIFK